MKTAILSLSFILFGLLRIPFVDAQSISLTSTGFTAIRSDTLLVDVTLHTSVQPFPIGRYSRVVSGERHFFAIQEDGSLWSWGFNMGVGVLGHGGLEPVDQPQRIGTDTWLMISTGPEHALAIRADSTLWAWGNGADGRLGNGSTSGSMVPIQIGDAKWKAVAAGGRHSLAIQADGSLWSWGYNTLGQLGSSNYTNRNTPGKVGDQTWTAVAAGGEHSLGIRHDSSLFAWGRNFYGQLGLGISSTRVNTPTQVGTSTYKIIAAGLFHSLVVTSADQLQSFGWNADQQLGNGAVGEQSPIPILVSEEPIAEVVAGPKSSLIRYRNGSVAIAGTVYISKYANFTTLLAKHPTPPGAPASIDLTACLNGFSLHWTPPLDADVTGITRYRLEQQAHDGGWSTVGIYPSSQRQTFVNGLDPTRMYQFRISAINLDGDGNSLISEPTQPGQWPMLSCIHTNGFFWLNTGSLQNFFSEMGSEPEFSLVASQQYGLRWPAIHPYQDAQSSKALWISAASKVVHVGPRVSGTGEFIPVSHRKVSRHAPTYVTVNGVESSDTPRQVTAVDPGLISDQMIETVVDTRLGIRMTRRVHQWSNSGIDNVHLFEYIFTNTAEVPQDNVRMFWLSRYAPIRQTRYVIGNPTGWGFNTMIDRIGDGQGPDYGALPGIRGHIAWHGRHPLFAQYDNLGAPIFTAATSSGFVQPWDQTGRLGAPHFIGNMVLHAPATAASTDDSPAQPSTLTELHSDDSRLLYNSFDNSFKSSEEIQLMESGRTQRHAYRVEPSGLPGFMSPTGDPSLVTSGGWSAATGVGPYSMQPGQSVRILTAEIVDGIDRQTAETTGAAFKDGLITALQKNQVVFQGLDSLIATLNTVKTLSADLSAIPRTPAPPSAFSVNRGEGKVDLAWSMTGNPTDDILGFQLWRTGSRVDSVYRIIATLDRDSRAYTDTEVVSGHPYYYHILSVSASGLTSSRYASQTYNAAVPLQTTSLETDDDRPRTTRLHDAYPNPFNPITIIGFDLAASSNIRISAYDVLGREVAVLAQGPYTAGTHRISFDGRSLASGVYLIRLSTPSGAHIRRVTLLK